MFRRLRWIAVTAAIAVTIGVAGAVFGHVAGAPPAPPGATDESTVDQLRHSIDLAQARLRRLPADWQTWAALSVAYLEESRISADPTWYPKAQEAAQRSLDVHPDGNVDALVAQGALANARHDFGTAQRLATSVIAVDPYHADAFAVLADAETQLGHRAAATAAVQRLLDLRPGLSGYARASYDLEQRGLTIAATDLMSRALAVAVDRHDIAFTRNQLGDLALAGGDLATADIQYAAGQAADPSNVALLRGRARVAVARGQLTDALIAYAGFTRRAPTPTNLIEYADLLRLGGRATDADTQLRLARAANELFVASGGTDGLTGAALAEAAGDPVAALAAASAEWNRRQHVDVADAMAWALHLGGRDREALTYAGLALATGARSAPYAYHAGMIELALGDRTAARAQLTDALAINPYFSPRDVPSARRALAELGDLMIRMVAALALLTASPVAHPLGNFSVNEYVGLTVHADRVEAVAVVDAAEIPTLQDRPAVDTNGDGTTSAAERASHAGRTCADLAGALIGAVDGHRLLWTVGSSTFDYAAGAGGLDVSRLRCALTAPATVDTGASLRIENTYLADRVGWRELTAVGAGVGLDSPVPATSVSRELTEYPKDLLSSALDVRSATIAVTAGGDRSAAVPLVSGGDPISRWLAGLDRTFQDLAGGRLTVTSTDSTVRSVSSVGIGLLAVLLAMVLGAGHAALPGHGKTILAAYLAGKRGRRRDAFAVAGTVTLTHTGGVLALGLILTAGTALAGEAILGWLGLISGLIVVALGAGMLIGLRRRRAHHHDHPHPHPHPHVHHGHDHDHDHGVADGRTSRWGLAGIGLAGGLVPSPSALVVLLAAIGLGRTGYGVLLVIAYGAGMAATLTGAGLLLLAAQRRLARTPVAARLGRLAARLTAVTPAATATMVLLVGTGLAIRAGTAVL